MSIHEVVKFPSPILRKISKPISKISQHEPVLLEDMVETMYQNRGIGLAAVQVGVNLRLAVVDIGDGPIKLINPKLINKDGHDTLEEGCLSIPGANISVKRAKNIKVEYLDIDGNKKSLNAEGILARAIQHEIDHLNGRLIIDYLNPIKRFFIKHQLKCR